jgi:hypothetical protein
MDLRQAAEATEELRSIRLGLERSPGGNMQRKMAALLAGFRIQGDWNKSARMAVRAPIDRHRNYRPAEVAAILGVSYDTAVLRI